MGRMIKINHLTNHFFRALIVVYLSAQMSDASIDQNAAKKLCGVNSTSTSVVISAVKKANKERNWDKVFGCGALAVSLENNVADEEASKGFVNFYDNAPQPAKLILIELLSNVVWSASLLRDSHSLGAIFTFFVVENYHALEVGLQEKYSAKLSILAAYWSSEKDMAPLGHFLQGQAYMEGIGVDKNMDAAMTEFEAAITAYNPKIKGFVNIRHAVEISRAKYCWLVVGTTRAEDHTTLRQGITECFLSINADSNEVEIMQIAVGGLAGASLLHLDESAQNFWQDIFDYFGQTNMSSKKANKYFKERCRAKNYCKAENMYETIVRSTSLYEDNFIASSLLNRVKIQSALKNAGYYKGQIDGLWGNLTNDAIKTFSKSYNTPLFKVKSLNENLLGSFSASDQSVNYAIAEIYKRIKGQQVSNYAAGYRPQRTNIANRSFRKKSMFRTMLEDNPYNSDKDSSPFTNIYYKGTYIRCHTGAGVTLCN